MIAVSARPLLAASTAPAGADRDGGPAVIHAHLISLRAVADVLAPAPAPAALSAPATSTQEDA
ncbi:hypothetical protein [Methylobacterium oryzisoli]|uniref:hypothetical protein n=1 Tax=Methylobacterium oryzisoli TaxID=3385502 RepID=UPI0038916E7A